MKINDALQNLTGLGTDKVETKSNKPAAAPAAQQQPAQSGQVTLSPMSTQLQALEASIAGQKVFDTDKVESIKRAIASGEFKVDAEKVAEGLINSVSDLLRTRA